MPSSVLLSVKPEFANAILDGVKRFEFRRVLFSTRKVSRIVLYASSPVQRVIGDFQVSDILSLPPDDLWQITWSGAGISQEYFESYFRGKNLAHAIGVHNARRFARPRRLASHYGIRLPPQSFCYLD
jgi:predicted transcriptional regulator